MSWTKEQLEELLKRGKNFRSLKLHGADFSGMDLEKADFRSASCPYANFSDTNVKFADFEGANLTLTKWDRSILHRTNLKDATLCDADMSLATDFYGVTITMECRCFKGLKLKPGHWWGFIFYAAELMEAPSKEDKEKLLLAMGIEKYTVLKDLYANRRM